MSEKIDVMPSKNLLIETLTEDINAHDAVLDLLDNSVDSYVRNKIEDICKIELNISSESFSLYDNCGGIDKEELTKHAFKIGFVDYAKKQPTIGRYGVGLKRSLFKIGKEFKFVTDNGEHESKFEIDVDNWIKDENNWTFDAEINKSKLKTGEKPYTKLEIVRLTDEIKEIFDQSFENQIKSTIQKYYTRFINDKIEFYVNGEKQAPYELTIKTYKNLTPARFTEEYEGIQIDIICWINARKDKRLKFTEHEKRGWNIFMNDRLVINADTSEKTGWSAKKTELPKFHSLYNQFMGIVSINTSDPHLLPINTSKNGFNEESKIYKHLKTKMIETARPLITYLNQKRKKESDQKEETDKQIEDSVNKELESIDEGNIKELNPKDLDGNQKFTSDDEIVKYEDTTTMATISYEVEIDKVEEVKKLYKINSNKEVGLYTFEYFWEAEDLGDE